MKHQKSCSIYLRLNKLYISPLSLVGSIGPWIHEGEPIVVDIGEPKENIGQAISSAINKSRWDIDLPANFEPNDKNAPLLKAAGVKSWRALEKPDTKHISVAIYNDGMAEFIPSWNKYVKEGKGRGFIFYGPEKIVRAKSSDLKEIGEAALEALKRSD